MHGRGVGAQEASVGKVKGVLLVSRRVIGRRVECIETMPLGVDIRTIGERKSHPAESLDRAIL